MKKIILIVFLFLASTLNAQKKTIIQCGKLVDVINNKILDNMTIVIVGDKVQRISDKLVKYKNE